MIHSTGPVTYNIGISIVGFGVFTLVQNGYPYKLSSTIGINKYSAYPLSLFKFFASFAALLLVILTLGSDAIPMGYQINAH